jgi:DNA-binding CsgD family transcriptional regulator
MNRVEGEWLDLLADLLAQPLQRLPVERIAAQLAGTFRAPGVAFTSTSRDRSDMDLLYPLNEQFQGRRGLFESWGPPDVHRIHPLLLQSRAVRRPVFGQVASVSERFAGRRERSAWRSFASPGGVHEQVCLPLGNDLAAPCFVVGRDREFSPREMTLAAQICRVINGLHRQATALSQLSGDGFEAASAVRLTVRELAVLALLAEGLTAAAIGHRLMISERTVHKHLQRTYSKLGVTDRLSAVLVARRQCFV